MTYKSFFILDILVLKQVSSFCNSSKEGKRTGIRSVTKDLFRFTSKLPKNVRVREDREKIANGGSWRKPRRKHDKIISLYTSTKCVRISMLNIRIRFTPGMRKGD